MLSLISASSRRPLSLTMPISRLESVGYLYGYGPSPVAALPRRPRSHASSYNHAAQTQTRALHVTGQAGAYAPLPTTLRPTRTHRCQPLCVRLQRRVGDPLRMTPTPLQIITP